MSTDKERRLRIAGSHNIETLRNIVEKAYFETSDPQKKRFLANLLSRLA